jgi:Ca2+-binding EF-hand superfamily protein
MSLWFSQARIEHNKQRNRLKEIMQTVSYNGEVNTGQLQLAAKLAKIDLPEDFLLKSPYAHKYASGWEADNSPRGVKWRPFYEAIEFPKLKGESKDQFLKQHAAREAKRLEAAAATAAASAAAAAAAEEGAKSSVVVKAELPYVSDADLRRAHAVIKARLSSQFGELRQAFRAFDDDGSGFITHAEAEATLSGTLNLGLPKRITSRIIDIADFDGDGEISFAEFARVLTADDIIFMKNTTNANVGDGVVDSRLKVPVVKKGPEIVGVKNGVEVTAQEVRSAIFLIKESILRKHKRIDEAFKAIDDDRSGFLSREELRFTLHLMNLTNISRECLEVVIDLVDNDGDGQINHNEFANAISAKDPLALLGKGPRAVSFQG